MFSSKKDQKRRENALVDIINERDNSNKCGDCGATFPTWASVNLGIFLCGRCASIHRNFGEDISIVKSLTLDKWTDSDLDSLSSIGNRKARKFWNPKKVPFPYDDDDKDEITLYLRNKYVVGKFRFDAPKRDDYNLDSTSRSSRRDRFHGSSVSSGSRPGSSARSRVPRLSHKDIPEIERLKYRKLEPKLQSKGFNNTDDNYEALSLAKGDIPFAIEILSSPDNYEDSNESKPPLPKRPGQSNGVSSSSIPTSSVTATKTATPAATGDWWSNNGNPASAPSTAPSNGLIEPPQQYLDPATGIIYVDPAQQQLYEQQQAQLLQQQQTNVVLGALPQFQQSQQPQQTGIDKNQLLSLYNTGGASQQQQQQQQQLQPQYTQQSQFTASQTPFQQASLYGQTQASVQPQYTSQTFNSFQTANSSGFPAQQNPQYTNATGGAFAQTQGQQQFAQMQQGGIYGQGQQQQQFY